MYMRLRLCVYTPDRATIHAYPMSAPLLPARSYRRIVRVQRCAYHNPSRIHAHGQRPLCSGIKLFFFLSFFPSFLPSFLPSFFPIVANSALFLQCFCIVSPGFKRKKVCNDAQKRVLAFPCSFRWCPARKDLTFVFFSPSQWGWSSKRAEHNTMACLASGTNEGREGQAWPC